MNPRGKWCAYTLRMHIAQLQQRLWPQGLMLENTELSRLLQSPRYIWRDTSASSKMLTNTNWNFFQN